MAFPYQPVNFQFIPGTTIFSAQVNANFQEGINDLNDHVPTITGIHGVGAGVVVGTTITQTLSNKTFLAPLFVLATDPGVSISPFVINWRSPSPAANDFVSIPITQNSDTTPDAIKNEIVMTTTDVTHATRSSSWSFFNYNSGTQKNNFTIAGNGDVGITSGGKFHVDGTLLTGDTYFYESSSNVVTHIAGGLTTFIEDSGIQIGVNGTLATPCLRLNNTNTGFYLSAANTVGVAAGGGDVAQFSSSAVTFASVGTANSAACQISAGGVITHPVSSLKYKKDIVDLTTDSSKIYNLRPVNFNYKSDDSADIGFIAEEVELVEPLFVFHNPDGTPESVHYEKMVVLILAELKKLKISNDDLVSKIHALEEK